MLDDLRQATLDQDDEPIVSHRAAVASQENDRLFGLTAIERMFLSIGLFFLTLVGSVLLLLVTESIALNF
jgi:hypothetical protein